MGHKGDLTGRLTANQKFWLTTTKKQKQTKKPNTKQKSSDCSWDHGSGDSAPA
jgi:hypothetical protein